MKKMHVAPMNPALIPTSWELFPEVARKNNTWATSYFSANKYFCNVTYVALLQIASFKVICREHSPCWVWRSMAPLHTSPQCWYLPWKATHHLAAYTPERSWPSWCRPLHISCAWKPSHTSWQQESETVPKEEQPQQLQQAFHSSLTDVLDLRSLSRAANCVHLWLLPLVRKSLPKNNSSGSTSVQRARISEIVICFFAAPLHIVGVSVTLLPRAAPSQVAGARGSSPCTLGSTLFSSSIPSVLSVHICYCSFHGCKTVLLVSASE